MIDDDLQCANFDLPTSLLEPCIEYLGPNAAPAGAQAEAAPSLFAAQ